MAPLSNTYKRPTAKEYISKTPRRTRSFDIDSPRTLDIPHPDITYKHGNILKRPKKLFC